jgi:hypothetical protein
LRGVRREHRAIGLVEAEPRIRVAGEEFSALELSLQLSAQAEYVRLPDGRVAADLLREAGLAGFGRAVDGATLAPFPLGPEAVLWHDFSQVPGPWQDILPLGLQPPATGSLCKNAYNHLEWLRTWGFSGGLVGTLHKVGTPLIKWLKDYANRVEQAAVLIIGTITVQNYINRLADGELIWRLDDATNQKEPKLGMLNLVTPELLEKAPSIAKANWDIVCLINADSFLATKSTRLFGILHTMPKALFVGLFAGLAFREREAARDACASLLGISPVSPTHMIWRYLLRNPAEAAKPLPEPPSAQPVKQSRTIVRVWRPTAMNYVLFWATLSATSMLPARQFLFAPTIIYTPAMAVWISGNWLGIYTGVLRCGNVVFLTRDLTTLRSTLLS